MFHILGFIFFIIFFVLIIGFFIIYKIARTLFGLGKKAGNNKEYFDGPRTEASDSAKKQKSSGKGKVFDDNEGEYIEFEEIKD